MHNRVNERLGKPIQPCNIEWLGKNFMSGCQRIVGRANSTTFVTPKLFIVIRI